jgi:hypothetical protein
MSLKQPRKTILSSNALHAFQNDMADAVNGDYEDDRLEKMLVDITTYPALHKGSGVFLDLQKIKSHLLTLPEDDPVKKRQMDLVGHAIIACLAKRKTMPEPYGKWDGEKNVVFYKQSDTTSLLKDMAKAQLSYSIDIPNKAMAILSQRAVIAVKKKSHQWVADEFIYISEYFDRIFTKENKTKTLQQNAFDLLRAPIDVTLQQGDGPINGTNSFIDLLKYPLNSSVDSFLRPQAINLSYQIYNRSLLGKDLNESDHKDLSELATNIASDYPEESAHLQEKSDLIKKEFKLACAQRALGQGIKVHVGKGDNVAVITNFIKIRSDFFEQETKELIEQSEIFRNKPLPELLQPLS